MIVMRIKLLILSSVFLAFLFSCTFFHSCYEIDRGEVAGLEEYLIDFSKKIEGHKLLNGPLPADLNAEKFFAILDPYYPDKSIIAKVREYPVKVSPHGESYVLTLCDKKSRFMLYKDLGETITLVDFPYWREKKKEKCQ